MDHIRGWFALALALLSSVAYAGPSDCPVAGDTGTDPEWPAGKTPNGAYSVSGQNGCNALVGATWGALQSGGTTGLSSFAAAIAHITAVTGYSPTGGWPFLDDNGQERFYCAKYTTTGGAIFSVAVGVGYTSGGDCTPPPPPEAECGNEDEGYFLPDVRALTFAGVQEAIGACYNGCAIKAIEQAGPGINKDPDGTFSFPVFLRHTGDACQGGGGDTEPPVTPDEKPEGENCVTSSAGVEYCNADAYGENCGYVNDNFVCLGKTDADECWVNEDGSRLCGESAPTPPVPDSGTAGVKATPDDTVKQSQGIKIDQTFNYYTTTTVAGASRPAGDTGNNPNRPASTDPRTGVGGGGTGEEGNGGSASGGASCEAPPECSGDAIQCAQLLQQWRTRCVDQPTEQSVLDAISATDAEKGLEAGPNDGSVQIPTSLDGTAFIGGASCPSAPTISVMGQSISLQKYWDVACDMAILFAPIVQAMGALFAALIIFRTNWS